MLFDMAICAFEGYLYYGFWSHFLDYRIKEKWKRMAVISTAMALLFIANHLNLSLLNLVVSVLITLGACTLMFSGGMKQKIYMALVGCFIMVTCEFLVTGLFSINSGHRTIDFTNGNSTSMFIILVIKLLTLGVFLQIEHRSKVKQTFVRLKATRLFYCFPIVCLMVYMGIWYSEIDFDHMTGNTWFLLLSCGLLLCSNLVLFSVYEKMAEMMNRMREYEINEMKSCLENQHYREMEEIEQKQAVLLHNMSGYLKTIKMLAMEEQNEKITNLIGKLDQTILDNRRTDYCRHPVLNAILNQKCIEAEEKSVKYQAMVEPGFEVLHLKDIDLISVISNLMDNAIEAASQCEDGFVNVQFYKANDGRFTIYKFINNYNKTPKEFQGRFITGKKDPHLHGIGLDYVKSVIEQSGGQVKISYQDRIFEVTVMF